MTQCVFYLESLERSILDWEKRPIPQGLKPNAGNWKMSGLKLRPPVPTQENENSGGLQPAGD
jgi:hypothetical protein